MKRTPVIAIVAATLITAVLLWRQSILEDEVAALRAALENLPAPVQAVPGAAVYEAPRFVAPSAVTDNPSTQTGERIADLERVANAHADLIEELLRKFNDFEFARQKAVAPGWSVLQAIGPPDTMSDGDHQSAWAPAQPDGGEEWLVTEFVRPVEIAQVVVRETCGPGCIVKITSVTDAGVEVPLWQGEPPKNASPSNTVFAVPPGTTSGRIKVYLDTKRVAGWNEIDAVQVVGRDGSRQWAKTANASSSYGGGGTLSLGLESGVLNSYGGQTIDLFGGFIEKTETTGIRRR